MEEQDVFQILELAFQCKTNGLTCKKESDNLYSIEKDLDMEANREHCFHMWNLVDYGQELIDSHFKHMFISGNGSWPATEMIGKYISGNIKLEVTWIQFDKKDYFIAFI